MSFAFFIGPADVDPNYNKSANKFILSPEAFTRALDARWKNVRVSQPLTEAFSLDWRCSTNHPQEIWGSLFANGCTISLEKPDIEDVAEIAVWYRTIIPSEVPLEIYNDMDADQSYRVTNQTTYLQIIDFYSDRDYMIQVRSVADDLIDLEKLERDLRQRWSRLEIFPITDIDPYSFYWENMTAVEFIHQIKISASEEVTNAYTSDILQTGAVSKDKTTLYLSAFPIKELAKALIWYRSVVDPNIELLVELKADRKQLILRTDTSAEEIINKFRPHG